MKFFKWLKRDHNRRHSDSHAIMVPSPLNLSTQLERTLEDEKALSEFSARRSLEPNSKPNPTKRSKHRKRQSLPNSNSVITEHVPEIQFLYGGQVFMPGSGNRYDADLENSCLSTSPDLLPPRFLRGNKLNIDDRDCGYTSPPKDFFKDNSLPYVDKSMQSNDAIENFDEKDLSVESDKSSRLDMDSSFGSVVRKLEQMCESDYISNFSYFRGIPLVKLSTLRYDDPVDGDNNKYWQRGSWTCMPVLIKKNVKSWSPPSVMTSLDDFVGKDLEILTKFRHPNFLLLLGLCYDDHSHNIQSFYEESIGTLHEYVHDRKNKLSCQTSLRYLSGIASALLYLQINKYVHSAVSSHTIMLTSRDVAKLYNFELICRIKDEDIKKQECDPYKLHYSLDPEYENLNEYTPKKTTSFNAECEFQDVRTRSIFAPYRWQAPEQFDESAGFVYACKKTDVYSLCLVLWECLNCSPPWKTLSYDQLSELYFTFNTGIRLPTDGRYPESVFELLSGGLEIKPDQRDDIETTVNKFKSAIGVLDNAKDVFVCKTSPKTNGSFSAISDDAKRDKITDLDEVNTSKLNVSNEQFYLEHYFTETKSTCLNVSTLPLSSKDESINESPHDQDLHNSNSTEYLSLMTPDVKRYLNRSQFTPNCHDFKLSTNMTPKSYKSLEIEPPPIDKINTILNLTKGFESEPKTERSRCIFDIDNTTLPDTPIARNTKIRRNAWLSGESDLSGIVENADDNESWKKSNVSNTINDDDTDVNACIVNRGRRRHSLINIKYDAVNGDSAKTYEDHFKKPALFRTRSQSWSMKSLNRPAKSNENITGVDIRPLVEIHEGWIREARKHSRQFVSLPDSFSSTSSCAVKPASHLTDSIRPRKFNDLDQSSKKSEYYYENNLWQKEKKKVLCNMNKDSRKSSTPNRDTDDYYEPVQNLINKFTIPETAKARDGVNHRPKKNFAFKQSDEKSKCDKSTFLVKLMTAYEKIVKPNADHVDSSNFNGAHLNNLNNSSDDKATKDGDEHNEDSISLPEHLPQQDSDDPVNKALKRCQAFSALQNACSTEDMYIDDEYASQVDIQNLGDNIQLQSTIHERTCRKGGDCCFVQIKNELKCNRILLYCENMEKLDQKGESPHFEYYVDREPDLIDFNVTKTLPVIEERSEEGSEDAAHVQDLITMYESDLKSFISIDDFDPKGKIQHDSIINDFFQV